MVTEQDWSKRMVLKPLTSSVKFFDARKLEISSIDIFCIQLIYMSLLLKWGQRWSLHSGRFGLLVKFNSIIHFRHKIKQYQIIKRKNRPPCLPPPCPPHIFFLTPLKRIRKRLCIYICLNRTRSLLLFFTYQNLEIARLFFSLRPNWCTLSKYDLWLIEIWSKNFISMWK